jgi:uncharacterized protein DUF1877
MYGHLRQISPAELDRLQTDPESVEDFLHGKMLANAEKKIAALQRVQQIGLDAKAAGILGNPAEQEKVRAQILQELTEAGVVPGQDGPTEEGLSLEKSWHALHYLLTGTAEQAPPPLGNVIMGGEEIGEDRDYGGCDS